MRVGTGRFRGWEEVILADETTAVHVLPEKGAEIRAIIDRTAGINLLFEAPWGLQPPGSPPREGWMEEPFLANYAGGWQELLPNTNDRCVIDDVELPFHGETAELAWTWQTETGGAAASVSFDVNCRLMPLHLHRRMSLPKAGEMLLEEEVTNTGNRLCRFTWGHHCVLGPPLVGHGARMDVAPGVVTTPAQPWEDTHRLRPGQRVRWPWARLRSGEAVDLREVPGPDAGSHDDVFIDELRAGWAQVLNPELRLGFRMEWDPAVFGALISWQPFGGALAMPLAGSYALGIEPWVAAANAASAAEAGRCLTLEPGERVQTLLRVRILRTAG